MLVRHVRLMERLAQKPRPLGLQLIGRAYDEETVLRTAHVLQQAAAFKAQPEQWWKA